MNQAPILYPIAAMLLLTTVVAALLLRERITEMKARRIHPTQVPSSGFAMAAWAYAVLRVLHSVIHVGYNKLVHRFAVFALSSTLLLGMWIVFIMQLTQRA